MQTVNDKIKQYCGNCTNIGSCNTFGKEIKFCNANVNYPERCILNKENSKRFKK